MPLLPTGSKMDLAFECPPSRVYPSVDTVNEAGVTGLKVHEFLEICNTHGPEIAYTEVGTYCSDELDERVAAVDLALFPIGDDWQAEVSFLYDVVEETSDRLGQCLGRNYPKRTDSQITMTIDVLGVREDRVIVIDYKTGRTEPPRPQDSGQLLMGALAAATYYQKDIAEIRFMHMPDSHPTTTTAMVNEIDLSLFAVKLRTLRSKIAAADKIYQAGGKPALRSGEHCTYCPAFDACPAQRSIALMLMDGDDTITHIGTRKKMGQAYMMIKQFRALATKFEKQIIAEASREPIELPDGRMLGQVVGNNRETLDGPTVFAVMSEIYDEDTANASVELSTAKTKIGAALKLFGVENMSAAKKEVFAEVRKRGGSTNKKSTSIKVYKKEG